MTLVFKLDRVIVPNYPREVVIPPNAPPYFVNSQTSLKMYCRELNQALQSLSDAVRELQAIQEAK